MPPRVLLLALLALAAAAALPAAAPAAPRGPGAPIALAQGWEYAPDPGDQGETLGWPSGRRGGGWEPVTVPHVFDPRPVAAEFFGTVGWYRLTFNAPAAERGIGWALRFDQVRRTAKVWLNGRAIGSHRDPYTPFELNAAGLRAAKPNTLVVRVDSRKGREPREGWWNWGGITRRVTLVARGAVALDTPGLLARRQCDDAGCRWSVRFDGWLRNDSARAQQPAVAVALRAPDGTVSSASAAPRALRAGERVRLRFRVPIRGDAQLWSPEHPALYAATVQTRVGGRLTQVDHLRTGLRTVRVVDGALELNGRVLDLRGASIQEDVPGHGPALSDADVDDIVDELKALGANVTRAHYLLDERLLDRFDQEGILVWSQAPVYHRDVLLRTPGERSYELGVVRDTILAARNHPSVITNSVANELSPQPDAHHTTRVWMLNAAQTARDLDPGMPVSIDVLSYPGIGRQRAYDAFDMLGINSYYGWYDGKRNRSTANIGDLAPFLRAMHDKYPRQALVMSEFGAEATEPGPADVKQTYAFQSRYVTRNLDVVQRLGFMGGAIYWTAREFAVKPHWDGGAHPGERDSIHNKGLIAYDGKIKPAFATAREDFRATPLYRADPLAVARAQLAHPRSIFVSTLLVLGVLALVAALLTLDAWCLRDIWRALRPRSAEVVELRRVA